MTDNQQIIAAVLFVFSLVFLVAVFAKRIC